MVGCASSTMFRRVKRPSASWNPPMARKLVGRIRNNRAKTKNGATPAHRQSSRRRRDGADCLDVYPRHHPGLGDDDLDLRVALEGVAIGERVVVPADDDGGGALGERRDLADDGDEVPALVQLGEELEPGLRRLP